MNKYGNDNFSFEIVEECNPEELDKREVYWIGTLKTLEPDGYNITPGGKKLFGKNNPFYNKKHTEETRKIISEKNKGKTLSEEEKRKRSLSNLGKNNPFYGKKHTKESLKKMQETKRKTGANKQASIRMKENNPNDGSYFSKQVGMFSMDYDLIKVFSSGRKAGEYMKEIGKTNAENPQNSIYDSCKNRVKSAYGYIWKYIKTFYKQETGFYTGGHIISKKKKGGKNEDT